MSPEDFAVGAAELFGPSWRGRAAAALGVDESTIWRTLRPGHDVSGPFAATMRAWLLLHRMFLLAPPAEPALQWTADHDAAVLPPHDARWETDPAAALEDASRRLFGERWERRAASALGRNHTTFWRQIRSGRVPGPVVAAVRAWTLLQASCGVGPPSEPDGPYRSGSSPGTPPTRKTGSRYADLMR